MPARIYKTRDGCRVPSVTTIIGHRKADCDALVHWAWKLGTEGKDWRAARDAAANAGTIAHGLVERAIKGKQFRLLSVAAIRGDFGCNEEIATKAHNAFAMFLKWAEQTELKIVESELSLVSEEHRFGGTLDSILVHGNPAIGDWKTSNAIRFDQLIQVAAYGHLYRGVNPEQPIAGYHIIRFAKETADFEHRYFGEVEDAWQAFLHLRVLYDLDAKLKQRVQ